MLDSDIAKKLTGEWVKIRQGEAFPHPQRRVRISVEANRSMEVMGFSEQSDPIASSKAFADDLLAVIGDDLCAQTEEALVRKLVLNLIKWQNSACRTDDQVGDLLRELMADHAAACHRKTT